MELNRLETDEVISGVDTHTSKELKDRCWYMKMCTNRKKVGPNDYGQEFRERKTYW